MPSSANPPRISARAPVWAAPPALTPCGWRWRPRGASPAIASHSAVYIFCLREFYHALCSDTGFCRLDPATFNLDPAAVEKLLTDAQAVRAIMPVHLYGQCADMDAFAAIAQKHGVAIIEDAAQAFGANWRGKKAGTLGTAAAFSFYPTKNLSAAGDAGAVSTDNEELAAHVRRLRNHGSRQRYYHEEIGWNSRLDAIQAAVLRVKLKHIDRWNQQRRTSRRKVRLAFPCDRSGKGWCDDRRAPSAGGTVADPP